MNVDDYSLCDVDTSKLKLSSAKNYTTFSHVFCELSPADQSMRYLCFCKKPMIVARYRLRCPDKDGCGFTIDIKSIQEMQAHKLLRSRKINIPVCNDCHSVHMDMGRTNTFVSYMIPVFKCACDEERRVTVYCEDNPVFEVNFDMSRIREIRETKGKFRKNDSALAGHVAHAPLKVKSLPQLDSEITQSELMGMPMTNGIKRVILPSDVFGGGDCV